MISYADLIDIPVKPNNEKMMLIKPGFKLVTKPINNEMFAFTGNAIYVRKSVAEKLNQASMLLAYTGPNLQLEVVYGYRALSIQKKLFNQHKKRLELETNYIGDELLEATHRLVAVPEVAGHPTGGAIDIQIIYKEVPINMGTKIWEFNNDAFTFSPYISKQAQKNRQLLRNILIQVGFAPFDGEWWHFSYGDKEWAKYYNMQNAIYEQIEFSL